MNVAHHPAVGFQGRIWLREHRWGLLVALLAGLLRTTRLDSEFASSDAADLAWEIQTLVCSSAGAEEVLSKLGLYRLGSVHTLLAYAHASIANLLHLDLTGQGWVATVIAVSVVGVFCAYLLGSALEGKAAGVACAAALAVSPIHIMQGRHLGAPWAHEIAFQMAILACTIHLVRRPSGKLQFVFYALLSVYLWCGNQMMAIFPVVGFAAVAGVAQAGWRGPAGHLWSRFGSPWMLLFVSSAGYLAYVTFVHEQGHLAHALFEKEKPLGWHFENWYSDAQLGIGATITVLGLGAVAASAVHGVKERLLSVRNVPMVYFLCYTVPFWLFVSRETTLTRTYVIYSLTALLIVLVLAPFRFAQASKQASKQASNLAWVPHLFAGVCTGLLLIGAGKSVFKWYYPEWISTRAYQGSYSRELGISAAAAFIRADSGNSTDRVFSDASGGKGLEPPTMALYFRRPYYAVYDSPRLVPYQKFSPKAERIDYLVIKPENTKLAKKYFPKFHPAARITNESGKVLHLVYSKKPRTAPVVVLTGEEGRELYREVYPELCSR